MNSAYVLPYVKARPWFQEVLLVLGAGFIIALFSPVAIPLPFTPIPIALQPQVVLFLSAFLGSRRGALAVLAYLAQGAMGFPVFAGGKAGILTFCGPTGGYLIGYVLAAYITGYLIETMRHRKPLKMLCSLGLGNLAIYACGATWLAVFLGFKTALLVGVLPFLIGDALKLLLVLKGLKTFKLAENRLEMVE